MVDTGIDFDRDLAVRPVEGRDLTIARRDRRLLDVKTISFADGRLTAVVGPNGAGKSLLLRIVSGAMRPDSGSVTWAGQPPSRAGYKKLAMVPQAPVLLRRTALANISYALRAAGVSRHDVSSRASAALEQAGLSHLSGEPARLLSGGEQKRLTIARALATEPDVLMLDEPIANLDPPSALAIESMINGARDRSVTVVMVTHDLAQARRLADDIVFMHRGRIVERGHSESFFAKPATELAHAFLHGEIIT